MQYSTTAISSVGIVGLWGQSLPCRSLAGKTIEEKKSVLNVEAKTGRLFYIDMTDDETETEGGCGCRLHIYINENVSCNDKKFEMIGGSFLFVVSDEIISVGGIEHACGNDAVKDASTIPNIKIPVGQYVLKIWGKKSINAREYDQEIKDLVGISDWQYRQRMDKLWFVGCLPVIVGVIIGLVGLWKYSLLYLLPLAVIYWFIYTCVRKTGRYARLDRKIQEQERQTPDYIIELTKNENVSCLCGGHIRHSQ